jgi:hypothetical protein
MDIISEHPFNPDYVTHSFKERDYNRPVVYILK